MDLYETNWPAKHFCTASKESDMRTILTYGLANIGMFALLMIVLISAENSQKKYDLQNQERIEYGK